MNVLLLAAGLGTRLRPLTEKYPKPCVPFLNVPVGLYSFRFLEHLNLSHLVVNTHHLPEKVKKVYTEQTYFKHKIEFSDESAKILGSAGGLKKASQFFLDSRHDDDTVLLINGDEILFDVDPLFLTKALQKHRSEKNTATLVVMKHPEAGKKFGAIWCEQDTVKDIGKTTSQTGLQAYHYVGYVFLDRKVLETISENTESNIFYDVLIKQLSGNSVKMYEVSCRWYETGNPHDFFSATRDALSKLDAETLKFINQYDDSLLVKNREGVSLISRGFEVHKSQLYGYNTVAKSTNPNSLASLGEIRNCILFDDEVLTESYFKS